MVCGYQVTEQVQNIMMRDRSFTWRPVPELESRYMTPYECYENTTGREPFLLFDDGEQNNRMIAFATSENLAELAASDVIFSDGTFYTCPTIFYQIYSIHVQIEGIMTPVAYALLPGKSQAIYNRFFTLLQEHMANFQIPFRPTTAFVDFELRHRAMGRRRPTNLEPLLNRRTSDYQQSRSLARKTEEKSTACPPHQLHQHPDVKGHTERE
ncbi:uncharacterized protein LOC110456077 [Mizuhopecten yessoensis]|uniref:uncharacterized protein LOC110456077 n=1 Tax=Mizuhopecten yessoensis TaxID=6573 RepID=UPI000B45C446|nr:uncharacterized protein LOC110456077 [Mizuhopecten yessoensis]